MQRRADHDARQAERRVRTRRLIELGGLVQKSGLVELTGDDRTALYGGLLLLAGLLLAEGPESVLPRLARQGRRAFRMEQENRAGGGPPRLPEP